MEFIETPTFTRLLAALLTDDEYAGLQNVLVDNPERGDIIKGGGGIRKLRHALPGRGKSGGVRVIVSIHRNSIDTGKMRRSSLDPTFLLA